MGDFLFNLNLSIDIYLKKDYNDIMEKKIKKFHNYQFLNGLLLFIVIGLLGYALYSHLYEKESGDFEDTTIEEIVNDEQIKEIETNPKNNEEKIKENVSEKKEEEKEKTKQEQEEIEKNDEKLEPKRPKLVYRTLKIKKEETFKIPTLDFSNETIKEKEFIGDMRIRGVDCSHLDKGLRIKGDLHITGTGVERCWLPKGLSVVGSIYVKKVKSIIFQNDLKVQEKIFLHDDICVSIPLNSSKKVQLAEGIKTCN